MNPTENPNFFHDIEIRFKTAGPEASSFLHHLGLAHRFLVPLSAVDPLLKISEWLIATGVLETSLLYGVFDSNRPTTAALAVLETKAKKREGIKGFTLWNGQERAKGASISCTFDRIDGCASSFKLSVTSPKPTSRLGDWKQAAEALSTAAKIFAPIYAAIETMYYDAVFKDRPGVGWMLYLPRVLTVQQVPEARALVPVMGKDEKGKDKQIGTIIVSITDEPFSDENPEHVKIANAIEIRLVDQDLLPRYADL
jgi:hypothetical protein